MNERDLELSDGRRLHIYDAGLAGARLTIVWHHGTPNLGEPPEPLLPAAVERGIRWVSYDRPGYGGSSPKPGRDVALAAHDVSAIADALGIGRFAVIGHSGCGPDALSCGALLPQRVLGAVSISGLAPYGTPKLDWFAGMGPAGTAELRAAAAGRPALEAYLAATEFDPEYLELLQRRYGGKPNVEVRALDLAQVSLDGFAPGSFDTVTCARLLEHLRDDEAALRAMRAVLAPGGRVVLIVPALPALYGTIDRAIGQHRRYTRTELVRKLRGAGLAVEHVSYFNVLGVAGWFLNARILGRRTVPGLQARLNDRLVPLLRLERRLSPPIGMSLLAVGRAGP